MNKINDIDMDEWKEYDHIWTHSRWVGDYRIDKLKSCGSRSFHGNFIPEIPYQMMLRYTQEGDWVLDPMAGSGTTGDVANILNRKCDMYDINPIRDDIKEADAMTKDFGKKYDLIMLHPPYANIIEFSDRENDLSNYGWKEFLHKFQKVAKNLDGHLKRDRYLILVCGEIYKNSEEIPLGFYASSTLRDLGYIRKGVIVKDFGKRTQGGRVSNPKTQNLMRYRHLKYGTWGFCGDFIFVMEKVGKEEKRKTLNRI